MLADTPLVARTPAFNKDERMLAILAGGLSIGVLLGRSGKTEGDELTGSALMMFAAIDAALSS